MTTRQMIDDATASAVKADRLMVGQDGLMLSDKRILELQLRVWTYTQGYEGGIDPEEAIRTAVAEAVAAEKKANAKLVEDEEGWDWAYHTGDDPPFPMGRISYSTRHNIAAAILARGKEEQ